MVASVLAIDDFCGTLTGRSLRHETKTWSAKSGELLVARTSAWLDSAMSKLKALQCLEDDWDSYGAKRISEAVLSDGSQLLAQFGEMGLPAPHISPTAAGGIQFEWRVKGIEFDLELEPGGTMLGVFDDTNNERSWERDLPPNDLAQVIEALDLLRS